MKEVLTIFLIFRLFWYESSRRKLTKHSCLIFAEIVDAAILPVSKIVKIAKKFINDGANVIDLGCMPDTDFKHLEESINALKSLGIKVSVDSSNNEELIRASNAGADYIFKC